VSLSFFVAGSPITQGSKVGFMGKAGKVVMRESGRGHLDAWRNAVGAEARGVAPDELWMVPVLLTLEFRLQIPSSAPKRRRVWPIGKKSGDVDKLARACMDALTGVIFVDDAQVIGLAVTKDFGRPGVMVTIESVMDADIDWVPTWQPALHMNEVKQ
jgi:crossover junction endodeoxyribonuclease RusA